MGDRDKWTEEDTRREIPLKSDYRDTPARKHLLSPEELEFIAREDRRRAIESLVRRGYRVNQE